MTVVICQKTDTFSNKFRLPPKYYFGDQIKNNEVGRACSTYGREGKCTQGYGGETWGKRQLGKPTRRWEENIRMELQEVELRGNGWVGFAQERNRRRALFNAVMNLRVP